MTCMKSVQFLRPPTPPLSIYIQTSSTPFTSDVQSQVSPQPLPLQMITSQLKENMFQG